MPRRVLTVAEERAGMFPRRPEDQGDFDALFDLGQRYGHTLRPAAWVVFTGPQDEPVSLHDSPREALQVARDLGGAVGVRL